ncbi:fatty acyl-CoA reductase 1-like isoform X1 [Dermacentor andersoni]|uniref:fatty acyl-CoA reductase 1-like isoform X1 n=2 Tax=Dermacentor andersoni TaxID=34620 RepID=UPI002155C8C1|nr:fatty acyl-CoA reductase 1-like isoform X1 [Dermacentor andersoni]
MGSGDLLPRNAEPLPSQASKEAASGGKKRSARTSVATPRETTMATAGCHPQQIPSSAVVTEDDKGSVIAQFYQDQVVFLTGGTGFIGKVLLEKLLRSCPGVKQVYLLVRGKSGEGPEARLETMLKSKVFERLKQEQPGALHKVRAVAGDLTQPNLGLSAPDQATLIANVSVVFHSAATVKFDEPLKRAVQLNVLGTRRVVDLCKQMPNLCALVHVSTAYCNCDKPEVDEVIYPPPVDPQKIIEAAQWMDDKMMDTMSGFLLGQRPNTYTLTKALAESLVLDEREELPVAIVRPSIVTASWREPFPGWVDNYNGFTGIIVSCGLGLLQSVIIEKDCIADVIPVDVVANMLISVAWNTATTRPEHVRVYHCTSGTLQRQTWGEVTATTQKLIVRHPLPHVMRFPKVVLTNSVAWHSLNLYCLHYLPACIGDLALQLIGRKPRFLSLYQKVRKGIDVVQYFTTHGWLFRSNNVVALVEDLSQTDKQLFNFDVRNLEWYLYWEQYVLGIRKYLFKAEVSKLPEARKHMKWLYIMHLCLNLLVVTFVWRLLMTRSQTARNLCYFMLTFAMRLCKMLPSLRTL